MYFGVPKPLDMDTINHDQNMIATVDLHYFEDAEQKPVFQFVYASQLYGTLFALYGRFNIEEAPDHLSCVVKDVKLSLYNYVGNINMGFIADQPEFEVTEDGPSIYFGVRGTSMLREKTVLFPPGFTILKGERTKLIFNRVLYPLPDFTYEPTEDRVTDQPLEEEVPNTPVFDSEFQARSGSDYFNNPLRPGMAGYQGATIERDEGGKLKIASLRCTQSIVYLVY